MRLSPAFVGCSVAVFGPFALGFACMSLFNFWLGAAIVLGWFGLILYSLSEGWP